ncbi:ankyrin [Plenodomus tracheiphilus IPT5]|uniref:Ankyrin n=1 Tax=Plenodomus tracheiphilus IPT5 TaxID=1408161 RepID=A0A6A7BMR9_9PLEO|nr:ankyrin [Plenodomus tracheiphilus IPT5]
MPRPSTIAARCAAVSTSIGQVIPDISSFARKVRESRHDLNAINNDLLVIKTGLGISQDDFSKSGLKLPAPLIDALMQILDSCDNTSERLHKAFLKLSCGVAPQSDWQSLKDGLLVNLRHDLDASKVVLDLAIDYVALYNQQGTHDSLIKAYVDDVITANDELLKRTDSEEIYVNQTARDRLPSLLKAIRLLRSCITISSKQLPPVTSSSTRRTTIPRPDSLEPVLGDVRRSGRKSPSLQTPAGSSGSRGVSTWLANVPSFEDEDPPKHSAIRRVAGGLSRLRPLSRSEIAPSRETFFTDDDATSSPTLVPPESRIRKSRSWCTDLSSRASTYLGGGGKDIIPKESSKNTSTVTSSNVSIFQKRIISDKIAVAKDNRKDLETDERSGFDRILANIPAEANTTEVERVLWEGASPMASHPEFGYFFLRVAYEMSPEVLKKLLEFGADITRTQPSSTPYFSAMHAAVSGRQLPTVQYLVLLGHSIDVPNSNGETPLHLAVKTPGSYQVARYLVEMGADVNYQARDGYTPLQSTLKTSNLEGKERSMLIELLLAHGADDDIQRGDRDNMRGNSKGKSVLGLA